MLFRGGDNRYLPVGQGVVTRQVTVFLREFVSRSSREPVIIRSFGETYFHRKKTPARGAFFVVETTGLEPVTSRM